MYLYYDLDVLHKSNKVSLRPDVVNHVERSLLVPSGYSHHVFSNETTVVKDSLKESMNTKSIPACHLEPPTSVSTILTTQYKHK